MTIILETLFVGYIAWKLEGLDKELTRIRNWVEINFPDEVE